MADEAWRDRRLPESMREELRRPLGPVLSGRDAYEAVLRAPRVVTVGDACTIDLVTHGRLPDIAVIDFKTKREASDALRARARAIGGRVLTAVNPAGSLTRDTWAALDEAFKSPERVRIEVLGEEDLAALAAIDLAPEGTAVLYGMPDAGVVLVWVDARAKAAVRDLIARMV
ncbi:MAG TPA: DUF359 domain-containing protein [Thermoplasmata archaeon]|jgi:hypothetical protein|nr:DUF359 domain-containing protein [Thermoplasmata archaeon]